MWRILLPGFTAMALATALQAQSNSAAPIPGPVPGAPSAATEMTTARRTRESPVDLFRQLLQASPAERNELLASRPPATQTRLLAKVREYEALDPDERELRLRATELRWYLVPLMRTAPASRAKLLADVPEDLLPVVQSRLLQWDILPPPLQQEFLANDDTLRYFAQTRPPLPPNPRAEQIAKQFGDFFTFTAEEKQQVLTTLSAPEREQMEKTLQAFGQLPPAQRAMCVRNYARFANMSQAERAVFLKNAAAWSKMSAEERQGWRDLVANVPKWPPIPSALPPLPPPLAPHPVESPVKAGTPRPLTP